jgi:hypothetical protein
MPGPDVVLVLHVMVSCWPCILDADVPEADSNFCSMAKCGVPHNLDSTHCACTCRISVGLRVRLDDPEVPADTAGRQASGRSSQRDPAAGRARGSVKLCATGSGGAE